MNISAGNSNIGSTTAGHHQLSVGNNCIALQLTADDSDITARHGNIAYHCTGGDINVSAALHAKVKNLSAIKNSGKSAGNQYVAGRAARINIKVCTAEDVDTVNLSAGNIHSCIIQLHAVAGAALIHSNIGIVACGNIRSDSIGDIHGTAIDPRTADSSAAGNTNFSIVCHNKLGTSAADNIHHAAIQQSRADDTAGDVNRAAVDNFHSRNVNFIINNVPFGKIDAITGNYRILDLLAGRIENFAANSHSGNLNSAGIDLAAVDHSSEKVNFTVGDFSVGYNVAGRINSSI